MKKTIGEITWSITIGVVGTLAFSGVLVYGVKRTEASECAKWRSQANGIKGFYLAQWQVDQCASYE